MSYRHAPTAWTICIERVWSHQSRSMRQACCGCGCGHWPCGAFGSHAQISEARIVQFVLLVPFGAKLMYWKKNGSSK